MNLLNKISKLFRKKTFIYVIAVVGQPNRNGRAFTAECLQKMAEDNPRDYKFENNRLYSRM